MFKEYMNECSKSSYDVKDEYNAAKITMNYINSVKCLSVTRKSDRTTQDGTN